MLLIPCPTCGPRAETEFSCGGEGGIARPTQTDALSDAQWGDYVFFRSNPKGLQHEQWCHSSGCGRWFNVLRDTVSYRIHASWKIGEPAPEQGVPPGRAPTLAAQGDPASDDTGRAQP